MSVARSCCTAAEGCQPACCVNGPITEVTIDITGHDKSDPESNATPSIDLIGQYVLTPSSPGLCNGEQIIGDPNGYFIDIPFVPGTYRYELRYQVFCVLGSNEYRLHMEMHMEKLNGVWTPIGETNVLSNDFPEGSECIGQSFSGTTLAFNPGSFGSFDIDFETTG